MRLKVAMLVCLSTAVSGQRSDPYAGLPPDPSAAVKTLNVRSPEVHADRTVTFRLLAPGARKVELMQGTRENWLGPPRAMTAPDTGVWTITIGPLPPNIYYYSFAVNGIRYIEQGTISTVEVRDSGPAFDDVRDVPHGAVHVNWYRSNLKRTQRIYVYTPPGYENAPAARYPALYLLHGMGLNESAWVWQGHANTILDNLIAEHKAVPMILVMPFGQPLAKISGISDENTKAYEEDLMANVIPFVQANYRIDPDRLQRAIAGMSMGGLQSLVIGLAHLDLFSWIGGFSSAVHQIDPEHAFANILRDPQATNGRLRLLWIGCGSSDHLFAATGQLHKTLTSHDVRHVYHVSEGGHTWEVWRRNLYYDFIPLLFRKS